MSHETRRKIEKFEFFLTRQPRNLVCLLEVVVYVHNTIIIIMIYMLVVNPLAAIFQLG